MNSANDYYRFASRLFALRWIALVGQLLAIFVANRVMHHLTWQPMVAFCIALFVANLVIWHRLKRVTGLSAVEAFLHLLLDVFVLSVLLYYSGGASNPFVSLYLLPVALAAAALPVRYVIALVVICTAGYSFLFLYGQAMPHVHGVHGSDFDMHLAGMWLNFVITSILIAGFVTSLAAAVRNRDASLHEAKESALRQRSVIRMGALAAGAAHELGSPLSTMAILIDELKRGDLNNQQREDLELLAQQIGVCRHHLERLLSHRTDTDLAFRPWLVAVAEQVRAVRPECVFVLPKQLPQIDSQVPAVVEQALFTVLNNAADASLASGDQRIELHVVRAQGRIEIEVNDHGGAKVNWQAVLAQSTKPQGFGVGLNVAISGMETVGGDIRFAHGAAGSKVTIVWPEK